MHLFFFQTWFRIIPQLCNFWRCCRAYYVDIGLHYIIVLESQSTGYVIYFYITELFSNELCNHFGRNGTALLPLSRVCKWSSGWAWSISGRTSPWRQHGRCIAVSATSRDMSLSGAQASEPERALAASHAWIALPVLPRSQLESNINPLQPCHQIPFLFKRGKLFDLQLELFCIQSSFFAYSPLRPLLDALSQCKQKSSNCK